MIFNLFHLLTEAAGGEGGGTTGAENSGNPWTTYIMLGVMVIAIVALMIFNRRSQKKKQTETENMLNAIKPGNKVKTIGGICGIVVEVCPEDNTFVLETGTEASGKSYLKFDKQAVYQTDAVAEKPVEAKKEKVEEKAEEKTEAVEAPAEEAKDETKENK